MLRARAVALAAAAVALVACGRGNRPPETDTSKGPGVIDSAPGAIPAAVGATLTDENVWALLDTAYVAVVQEDSIGAAKATDAKVKAFAGAMLTSDATNRDGVNATFNRLQVRRVLPDRDVIKDHAKVMGDLRAKTGADFDKAYVQRAVDVRKSLIDECDDALKMKTRLPEVTTYLQQLRGVLQGELNQAQALSK